MKLLIMWNNGKPAHYKVYSFLFQHLTELGYESEVFVRELKHGTLAELGKRFMLLELKGEKESIKQFLQAVKEEHYEVFEEVA